ncbi:hypothetical protein DOY81_010850 [Sarcophaga bullata]|nr:hypothetical protein DOY81_010850 [Sarcophaga bullata]
MPAKTTLKSQIQTQLQQSLSTTPAQNYEFNLAEQTHKEMPYYYNTTSKLSTTTKQQNRRDSSDSQFIVKQQYELTTFPR